MVSDEEVVVVEQALPVAVDVVAGVSELDAQSDGQEQADRPQGQLVQMGSQRWGDFHGDVVAGRRISDVVLGATGPSPPALRGSHNILRCGKDHTLDGVVPLFAQKWLQWTDVVIIAVVAVSGPLSSTGPGIEARFFRRRSPRRLSTKI